MEEKLNLYAKLQKVRVELQQSDLKKSGENTYSKYKYFELGDFLPRINELCDKYGLNTLFNFSKDMAKLTIVNVDNIEEFEVFTTPVEIASLKGGTAMQNIGATQTYARRYLYVMAFEVAENDLLDAGAVDHDAEIAKQKISTVKAVIIKKAIDDTGTDLSKFLQYFNVKKVEDISEGQFATVMSMLDKKKEEKASKDKVASETEEGVWQ